MDLLPALILGLVQGFTEWLPISSSGHLVVAHFMLGTPPNAAFDVVLMAGTVAALVIYFRGKIYSLMAGLIALEKGSVDYLKMVVIAGVPTALAGFSGKKFFEGLFSQPFAVSLLIIVTGIFLFIASRAERGSSGISTKSAFAMGLAQGIAVAPGISRSGSTIGTALILGVKPEKAAEFSFIIGIPAMLVASLLEFFRLDFASLGPGAIAAGVMASFVAGYAGIGFFMGMLRKGRLSYFAYYCILAGASFAVLTAGH